MALLLAAYCVLFIYLLWTAYLFTVDRGGEDELILFLFLQGERVQTRWQLNSESSALTHFTLDMELSLVLANDTVGYGKAKPHAFAVGFGGEERLKNPLHIIF